MSVEWFVVEVMLIAAVEQGDQRAGVEQDGWFQESM
jgi:hypothetical protein